MEEDRTVSKMLPGKVTGKRSLRRPRRRWEDNIRLSLKEINVATNNWVDSTHNRVCLKALVNSELNVRIP